jgi:pyrroline-5-carboxylate reductase
MLDTAIGVLGCGKMGAALTRGLVVSKLVPPERVFVSDIDEVRTGKVAKDLQVTVFEANLRVVQHSDVVVVALKPDVLRQELPKLGEAIDHRGALVVSIAAGVGLAELQQMLLPGTRVVRVMPNTPCQVGSGAAAFALGSSAGTEDGDLVNQILAAVGISFGPVPESWLDAVTGLSGSGPAFAAVVIEALADGGVLCGLPRDMAVSLAAQTVLGAARLVLERGMHPAELKDSVASPGGTTIEGLQVLEEQALRAALIDAVEAATLKSKALGKR